jgi:hypothetical protein
MASELQQIADALTGINEKMERFVAHLDKSSRDNDQWLEGRVTIDASTHMVLLEAVQKLSKQLDNWFKLQTKPRVFVRAIDMLPEDKKPLYWSNDGSWVDLGTARLFSDHEKNTLSLPVGGMWISSRLAGGAEGGWLIVQVGEKAVREVLARVDESEEELAGHDMDRCNKHHIPLKMCPDCCPMPEDPDELAPR